jgi:hypothetical protein
MSMTAQSFYLIAAALLLVGFSNGVLRNLARYTAERIRAARDA